jgi:hypothetical protein
MRRSSRTCGHIPTSHPTDYGEAKLRRRLVQQVTQPQKADHSQYGMLLTSAMPSCFAMVRLRRPATKTNPGKTLASWQALAKTPTPPALCNTRLSEKILNARVAETSDYSHAAIYSTSITFMPSMWGLRQRRADFFKAHCRN